MNEVKLERLAESASPRRAGECAACRDIFSSRPFRESISCSLSHTQDINDDHETHSEAIERFVASELDMSGMRRWNDVTARPPTLTQCQAKTSLRQQLQPLTQRRRKHRLPELDHHKTFEKEGIPGLFSKTGYKIAWTTYEGMIIQKLNELVAGEPIENVEPPKLAIQFARDPMNASLFNHASMAHNNHFFFQALSTSPQQLDHLPNLKQSLEKTFGSIETLRITMLDIAATMFGPGFVWLVWARDTAPGSARRGDWRILSTYLAGTPYPEAGYRQQGIDMNTNKASTLGAYQAGHAANRVGAFGAHSERGQQQAIIPPGGTSVMPVLCVNTWEHAYIYDYGLQGKRSYLLDWWQAVDWHTVDYRTPGEAKQSTYG